MSLVKPEKKQKFDGAVERLASDDARFLVMRGDYTAQQILDAAITAGEIEDDDREEWSHARYFQTWYKTSPLGGQDGYSRWNHPRETPCRGAYFASVLCWD